MPENKDDIDLEWWGLFRAAELNRVDIVGALIKRGDNVNGSYEDGMTPLHGAAKKNSLDAARLLIEQGAEVNVRYSYGSATLGPAGPYNCIHIDRGDLIWGNTPLDDATEEDSLEVARLLIEHGADVNAKAKHSSGHTPLHKAAEKNSLSVARLLIEHGAEVDAREQADARFVDLLNQYGYGADVNAKEHLGNTPLIMATKNSSTDVAKLLIEHGANTKGIDLRWMDGQEDA